jgi:cell division protein FtsB
VRAERPAKGRASTRRTTRVTAEDASTQGRSSRAKLTGRAAILLLVVAVLSVSYASSVRAWIHQRGEINSLNAEIAEREAAIAELRLEKQRWKDPAYIEIQARLRFGWLMPGETGYRVIGEDGEVLSAGRGELSDPAEVATAEETWWDAAWGSVVEAGKTPEEIAAEVAAQQPAHEPAEQIGGRGSGGGGHGGSGDR